MYIQKKLHGGYNVYLSIEGNDAGTGMDVGLLVLEAGERFRFLEPCKEIALLLLAGKVRFLWEGQASAAQRRDCFVDEAWCLHVCRETEICVEALSHAEIYVQSVKNPRAFPARLYAPEAVQVQHAGAARPIPTWCWARF